MKIKKFSDLEKLPTSKKVMLIGLLLLIFFSLYYLYDIKEEYIIYPDGCKETYNKGKLISPECDYKYTDDEWLNEVDISWTNTSETS